MASGIHQRDCKVRGSNRSGKPPATNISRSLRSLHKLCRPGRLYRLGTLCMLCSRPQPLQPQATCSVPNWAVPAFSLSKT